MTDQHHVPEHLYVEIKIVCEMMLKVHYFEPANWLWMAVSAPQACQTPMARRALTDARQIARQFGFPRVATFAELAISSPRTEAPPRGSSAPGRPDSRGLT